VIRDRLLQHSDNTLTGQSQGRPPAYRRIKAGQFRLSRSSPARAEAGIPANAVLALLRENFVTTLEPWSVAACTFGTDSDPLAYDEAAVLTTRLYQAGDFFGDGTRIPLRRCSLRQEGLVEPTLTTCLGAEVIECNWGSPLSTRSRDDLRTRYNHGIRTINGRPRRGYDELVQLQ